MGDTQYRYETIPQALAALSVHPSYIDTAVKIHDRTRKVRIAFTHAADKHRGVMIGWIVQLQTGEYRVLSKPTSKTRKLPQHIWRIDGVGPNPDTFYVCPALRNEVTK